MLILIIVVAFLIVMYVLIYAKRAKRNKKINETNVVDKYKRTYSDHRKAVEKRRDSLSHNNYVTKYNSTEDYREK